MINDDSKNTKLIEIFVQKYRIKRLRILIFHSQINEMIKGKHISINNAFSKLTLKDEKNEFGIFIQYYELIELLLKDSLK